MSTTAVPVPRALEYDTKIEKFRQTLEEQERSCVANGNTAHVEKGRKFDKVYLTTSSGQKLGRYMVDRNSWDIYGIKSWAQMNPRRWFGTLDTIGEYDWSMYHGAPKAGTHAEVMHTQREAGIIMGFKPRGRPKKNP
jgi:hypothetical protein